MGFHLHIYMTCTGAKYHAYLGTMTLTAAGASSTHLVVWVYLVKAQRHWTPVIYASCHAEGLEEYMSYA